MDAAAANRATLAVYERHIDEYIAGIDPGRRAPVRAWLEAVAVAAPGGHVLELGSGPGADAQALEDLGLTVRRTDATVAFVQRLRDQGHDADVLDARTDDLGGPYDVVVADAVLLHLSPDDLRRLLHRATDASSWLAITLKEGDGDAWSSRKLGGPRWFVYWREGPLRELLDATGWDVTWFERARGKFDDWLYVVARRR